MAETGGELAGEGDITPGQAEIIQTIEEVEQSDLDPSEKELVQGMLAMQLADDGDEPANILQPGMWG